jgi:hypothetical protein
MTRRVTELHNKRGGYTRYWFLCITHIHNRCRLIFRPIKSHTCSIGFMSGDSAGHGIVKTTSCCKKCCTIRAPSLTGHIIIWGGLFAHGDGSTGLMKVAFCYALPMVVQGFGANETLHFQDNHILGKSEHRSFSCCKTLFVKLLVKYISVNNILQVILFELPHSEMI